MPDLLERLKVALADRYAVESEIGRGGMATVFLARDLKHKRQVAIKVLHPELAATVGADRFLREIETVAGLTHPHILPLYDSGEADGLLYYTMPYVTGESLRQRLEREERLPVEEALGIAAEVAGALGKAHALGVVHRDIKPANILFESGQAMVADFGIARAVTGADGDRLTRTGLSAGTPAYMSPEQAAGGEVDERSDLYSLGCVLWEMLAGEAPFEGPTPQAILARKATEEPPRVRQASRSVPPAIQNLLARAMATSPEDRFQTAGELADALEEPETVRRVRSRMRRRTRRLAATAAAVLAVGAGLWAVASGRFSYSPPDEGGAIPLDSTAIAVLPFRVIGADSASPSWRLAWSMGGLFDLYVTGEYGEKIAHPGTVVERWQQAGGRPGEPLSEEAELEVGRALGVGSLVRGSIVETGDSITLAASMVDVATGEIRVRTVRVEGPLEERYALADDLIILIMRGEYGEYGWLTQYEPDAVEAFFKQDYETALARDSNLIQAALWIYAEGESEEDLPALQYAWDHQDQLLGWAREYLHVIAAGNLHGGITTRAEQFAAWEALARRYQWGMAWHELGHKLVSKGGGATASVPDWRRLAREALEESMSIRGPNSRDIWYLIDLAFINEDTVRIRDLLPEFRDRDADDEGLHGQLARVFPWRLAILEGDTAAATRALAAAWFPDSTYTMDFAIADGRGIADADRVFATGSVFRGPDHYWVYDDRWSWARGRYAEWRDARARRVPLEVSVERHGETVFQSLLLGSSEDSTAARAIQALERMARGTGDSAFAADSEEQTLARSWLTLWRLEHGDTTGARETLGQLADFERPWRFRGWSALLEVLLIRLEGGDVHATLLRADSVIAPRPLGSNVEMMNLMLARLLREHGEQERALAASRRRVYGYDGIAMYTSIPEYLREEAVSAAAVGDTTGALKAYRHYLALRDPRPDHPTWAAQWDSVRAEYASLTGGESP